MITIRCQPPAKERGQATVELALMLVFLVAFLLFAAMAFECAHMRIVANQAANVAARMAVYGVTEPAIARGMDVFAQNRGIFPGTVCQVTVQDRPADSPAVRVLRRINQPCDVEAICEVPIPLLTRSQILDPQGKLTVTVRSRMVVNRWNAALLFAVPVVVGE